MTTPLTSQTTTQPPLLPSLYALIPPSQLPTTQSKISLLSIHANRFMYKDKIYKNREPVLPEQRFLRIRNHPSSTKEEIELVYTSSTLREYDSVNVKAVIGVEVASLSLMEDVEDFVRVLGFE